MLTGLPQHPGMGSRTSSAPAGELYRLDAGRGPTSSAKVGHTLLEEDEGSSSMGHDTPKRSRSRHRGDEVSSSPMLDRVQMECDLRGKHRMANGGPFSCRNRPSPVYRK